MRRAAAVAVAAMLCALTGCSGDKGPQGTPAQGTQKPAAPTAEEELAALLQRRARALEAGSVRRYAATATGRQRADDAREARNARELDLRDVTLKPIEVDVQGRRAVVRARSGYGIRGVRGRFEAERVLRTVKTARGWRVRSEASRRQRHPWEVAAFSARRSPHFVILAPTALVVDGLPEALEDGYARMRDVLAAGTLRSRYLVVVAGDPAQARQMTSGIRGVATLAAISDTAVHEEGPAERVSSVASQRLLVVWPAFAPLDLDGRRRVVTHELTHAALARETSGRTPGWLAEGVALYVSGDDRVAEAARRVAVGISRRGLSLSGLSTPSAIAKLGGEAQSAAYAYSSAAAFYIVERFGRRRLFRLYDVVQRGVAARADRRPADRAGRARHARRAAAAPGARPAALDPRPGPPARLGTRCPSCPRSRRSAATSRPTSRGARSSAWRCSTGAGAARSRRASSPTRSSGRAIERLSRRGKYLVWELEGDVFLLQHLRMTGTLLLDPAGTPPHTRAWFELGDRRLAYTDPRRFGTGELALGPEALDEFFAARLGVEPLGPDFSGDHLYALARTSRAPIKAFLLDQRRVAGVGNIYADEALFRARLHPLRPANRVTRTQAHDLRDAVVASLEAGLAAKGATIDDFRHPDGVAGAFQNEFLIHLREGEPCPSAARACASCAPPAAGPTCASAASRGRA